MDVIQSTSLFRDWMLTVEGIVFEASREKSSMEATTSNGQGHYGSFTEHWAGLPERVIVQVKGTRSWWDGDLSKVDYLWRWFLILTDIKQGISVQGGPHESWLKNNQCFLRACASLLLPSNRQLLFPLLCFYAPHFSMLLAKYREDSSSSLWPHHSGSRPQTHSGQLPFHPWRLKRI